jgi:cytochrome b561
MNQSFMGRTSAQWVVMCLFMLLLVVPVAGLAHISYNEHGPWMVPYAMGVTFTIINRSSQWDRHPACLPGESPSLSAKKR